MTLVPPPYVGSGSAAITMAGFPAMIGPFPSVQPFSYQDGLTFQKLFENYRHWILTELIPGVESGVLTMTEAYNAASQALAVAMVDYKNEIAEDRADFKALVDTTIAGMNDAIAANAAAMAAKLSATEAERVKAETARAGAEAGAALAEQWAANTQALQDGAVNNLIRGNSSLTQAALKAIITPYFIGLGNVANKSELQMVQSGAIKDALDNLPKTVDGIPQDSTHDITLNPYDAFYGIRYLAFGHSFGVVQNIKNAYPSSVYPERLAKILDVDRALYNNATVSGQRMSAMLATVKATWNRGDYGVASIMCAANDLGNGTAVASWKSDLTAAMNWIRGIGPFAPTIVLIKEVYWTQKGYNRYSTPPNDGTIDLWNTYIDQVAATFPSDGSVIVVDPRPGWDAATMTAFDGQHPNEKGQAHIARTVAKTLRNRPYREGQNFGIATAIPYFYDSFNRDNRDDGIGYNLFGQGYTVYGGDPFGIISNRLRRVGETAGAGDSIAVQNVGYANARISLEHSDPGTKGNGIVFRFSDVNNHWVIDVANSGVGNAKVYKKVAGAAYAQVGSAFTREVLGLSRVELTCNGSTLTAYVDGVQAWTATDAFNSTATSFGVRMAGNNSRIDELVIKPF